MNVKKEKLKVRANLLGGFETIIGGGKLTEDMSRSKNLWNLFAYILLHRDRLIPLEELIEVLWGEDDCSNPSGALKTLMYRTRVLLEPFTGGNIQLIKSQRGSYCWNGDVECSVDAEEFDTLCRAAETTGDDEQKLECYRKAVALYKGGLLPKFASELWVVPLSTRYHNEYIDAVRKLSAMLAERELYDEMAEVCAHAVEVDPYDESLHAMYIRALVKQGKDASALEYYDRTTDMLYRNLGIRPSEELASLYNEIMQVGNTLETDLDVILGGLRETADRPGAFVCDYGFFKEIYRLEVRRSRRTGACIHIALVTIYNADGDTPSLSILNRAMDGLLELLTSRLRRGDVISRYSPSQYVLMLPTANFEDGSHVMERIAEEYYRLHRRSYLTIHYKLRQIELY